MAKMVSVFSCVYLLSEYFLVEVSVWISSPIFNEQRGTLPFAPERGIGLLLSSTAKI